MISNIKRNSKINSGINITIIQIGLFVIPLIVSPYVVKVVGIEHYGAYIFYQTAIGIVSVIINFGFLQTGVTDIAQCRSLRQINFMFSQIFYVKLFLLVLVTLLTFCFLLIPRFNEERSLYMFSISGLALVFLDVSYIFQGIERLKDYMIINFLGNIMVVSLLFTIIKSESTYVYLPLIFILPRILFSIVSVVYLYKKFGIAPKYFYYKKISGKLKSGFNFFLTTIFSILYTRTTIVFLGMYANNTMVGYFFLADQLASAYAIIQGKISTVYHPQIAGSFKNDFETGIRKSKENIGLIFIVAPASFLFTQFFSREILYFFFSKASNHSVIVLNILALNFITMSLTGILGIQVLVAIGKVKDLLKPSIFAALLNVVIAGILVPRFNHIGAALAMVIMELLICIYFIFKTRQYKVNVFSRKMMLAVLKYSLTLAILLIGLKFLYNSVTFNERLKLIMVMSLYGAFTFSAIHLLKLMDFKNRKLLIS